MKRKVNLYILSIVLLTSILISGIIAYNVHKQMNFVINDEKKQLVGRVIEEFNNFKTHVSHIQMQATYAYQDKITNTANYITLNWNNADEIPFDTLLNITKRIGVSSLAIIKKDGSLANASLNNNFTTNTVKNDPEFKSFIDNIYKTHSFSTYNTSLNPNNKRIYMHSYVSPKNSNYIIEAIINLDKNIESDNFWLLTNNIFNHIKYVIPNVNRIINDVNIFSTDSIPALFDNIRIQLNSQQTSNLFKNGRLDISTKGGEQFYYIIKIPTNISGLPPKLILYTEFDYSIRYRFAQNIFIYALLIVLLLTLVVSTISPIFFDKLFFNKISIINYNLNALRYAKYDSLKTLNGGDEMAAIANNIEFVKESVIRREKQLIESKSLAESADKLKSAFLANMSHEIRTPLNAVVGFAQLLRDVNPSPEDVSKYVGLINSNSNKLLQIISDIIDLSQIESGQLKIINRSVCLNELFTELYVFAQSKLHGDNFVFENKNIDIILDVEPITKGICTSTDPYRTKQIMEQLIDNALKFTCTGSVKIGFIVNDSFIELFVTDTGTGISKENISKIFDRFVQIEDYMTREYGGTGLGLAICSELANMLNGSISVKSTPNKGSTFTLKIPYIIPKC